MGETPFELAIAGGVLRGHGVETDRPWAVFLHGGPGLPDYMDGCVAELGGRFSAIRYTQRGTAPSTAGGPFTVESHMADALAVLDAFACARVWLVGHSWGGHLALHLAAAHPDRVHGVICVDTLGASADIFPEFRANRMSGLPRADRERLETLAASNRDGRATEADRLEELALQWPQYFARPQAAPPMPIARVGVECGAATNRSIMDHFRSGTLARALSTLRVPVLFVHGAADPLPARASTETAALIPGAQVVLIPDCGHFPWIDRPGALRDAVDRWLDTARPLQ